MCVDRPRSIYEAPKAFDLMKMVQELYLLQINHMQPDSRLPNPEKLVIELRRIQEEVLKMLPLAVTEIQENITSLIDLKATAKAQ